MKANDPIYPQEIRGCHFAGLTKRDYIAIQAMMGLTGNSELWDSSKPFVVGMSALSYAIADAMLKQSQESAE